MFIIRHSNEHILTTTKTTHNQPIYNNITYFVFCHFRQTLRTPQKYCAANVFERPSPLYIIVYKISFSLALYLYAEIIVISRILNLNCVCVCVVFRQAIVKVHVSHESASCKTLVVSQHNWFRVCVQKVMRSITSAHVHCTYGGKRRKFGVTTNDEPLGQKNPITWAKQLNESFPSTLVGILFYYYIKEQLAL